jgi:hypothetical protein
MSCTSKMERFKALAAGSRAQQIMLWKASLPTAVSTEGLTLKSLVKLSYRNTNNHIFHTGGFDLILRYLV